MSIKNLRNLGAVLLVLAFTMGQAYAFTMGSLGDSLTDEYLGNGLTFGETDLAAYNWVQILIQTRPDYVSFGALEADRAVRGEPRNEGYEYNWARSGATALLPGIIDTFGFITGTEVGSQSAGLAPAITAGQVDLVYIGIGSNDYFVRDGFGGMLPAERKPFSGPEYDAWEADLINRIFSAVDTLSAAGDPQILLALIPPGTAGGNDSWEMLSAIAHANSLLIAGAEARGIGIVDVFAWTTDPNRFDAQGNLLIGDLVIDYDSRADAEDLVPEGTPGAGTCDSAGMCAGPTHAEKFGADSYGHPNTAPSGLIANEIIAAMNKHYNSGIPLLSDEEIVALTGNDFDAGDPACISAKLKAVAKLCKSYSGCYIKETKNSTFDLDSCFAITEAKLESIWDKAEDKAIAKGGDCSTGAVTFIDDIILLTFEDMYSQITSGLDLEDKNALNIGSALLKAAAQRCSSILSGESANIKKPDATKLAIKISKAEDKFVLSWAKVMDKAISKGVNYTGPDMNAIEGITDNLVLDVLAAIEL